MTHRSAVGVLAAAFLVVASSSARAQHTSDAFISPSYESARRCAAVLMISAVGDLDPTNNMTRLVIDVLYRNDH